MGTSGGYRVDGVFVPDEEAFDPHIHITVVSNGGDYADFNYSIDVLHFFNKEKFRFSGQE